MNSTPSAILATVRINVRVGQPKAISPDLFGVFFEDINHSADGGLYAELVQNRSFAYTSDDHPDWNFLTSWELVGRECAVALGTTAPVHPNNPHYLQVSMRAAGGVCGLRNGGFDGISVQAGAKYDASLFARVMEGDIGPLTLRLENRAGSVLAQTALDAPGESWSKMSATLECSSTDRNARFVVLFSGTGSLALDVISLFPRQTFRHRPNGLRPDLAQLVADLKPRFVRFPGGCLAHGDGLDNMYRWKDTIGPIETRKEQRNVWGYHQSMGLGYFEYFQFCEDIGAKPLPVVPAGVCCQNSGARFTGSWGEGQCGLPLEEMPAYIQEVLDLIEWANGPATSTWGARRAAAGHPEPFDLEYLGVGNEDHITPAFEERFRLIHEAVRVRHPEITVVGTVGPFHSGEDFDAGWEIANQLEVPMVDEHYYETPDWFWDNLRRYEDYDRNASAVYLGEYAAHDVGRKSTLRSALAEAAFLTSIERNGDLVQLVSYAPLLAKRGHTQWEPDLIYFDNTTASPTVNYYVQQLFGNNAGDLYMPTEICPTGDASHLGAAPLEKSLLAASFLTASCVGDSGTGDLILKIVSRSERNLAVEIHLTSSGPLNPTAQLTLLAGQPLAENSFGQDPRVVPERTDLLIGESFVYDVPPHSLSVIRIGTQASRPFSK